MSKFIKETEEKIEKLKKLLELAKEVEEMKEEDAPFEMNEAFMNNPIYKLRINNDTRKM